MLSFITCSRTCGRLEENTVDSSYLMFCLSPFLNKGTRFLFSQSTEDFSNFKQFLKILKKGSFSTYEY